MLLPTRASAAAADPSPFEIRLPQVERVVVGRSIGEVRIREVDAQRVRVLGYLVPFWSLVITLTWIMISQIRLYDRITAARVDGSIK